jgi:hypothetical protein
VFDGAFDGAFDGRSELSYAHGVTTRTELIADLLMGAAHADPLRKGDAYDIVCASLKQVMGAAYILSSIDARLKAFDPERFSIDDAVGALSLEDDVEKRQLLELIAAVHEGDDVIAIDQDSYLRDVASALGVPDDEYADLTVDVQEARDSMYERRDSLYEARNSLLGPPPKPPPLPKT